MQMKFTRSAIGGLAGIAILAAAAPALARDADPKTDRAAPAKATKSGKAKAEQRYCVDNTVTGTRISRRTCQTAAQWSAQGVDIVAEAARNGRR